MDEECMEADWLQLPNDLLTLVTEKFSISDHIRFASVCFQWRFFSNQSYEQIKLPNQLPLLLIPSLRSTTTTTTATTEEEKNSIDEKPTIPNSYILREDRNYYNPKEIWQGQDKQRYRGTRSLYSLSEKRVYPDIQLPVPYNKNCRGSSHGWLVTVEEGNEGNHSIRLLNPFRSVNNEIQLPHCEQGDIIKDSFFFVKAVISESPSSNPTGFVVMAIYKHFKLCFWKPGDKGWNYLKFPIGEWQLIQDVLYHKEQFYAINQEGLVVAIDIDDHDPKVTVFAEPPKITNILTRKYLVESSGELLQVHRFHISKLTYSTIGFKVFKLDRSSKWVPMESLDGCTLFLGDNASMSVSTLDFPGCKPDCIYFTDDCYEEYSFNPPFGPHDMGVFSLHYDTFEPHCALGTNIIMPPPIWIQPIL